MPSGCIATDLRMVAFDSQTRSYTYELLLVNDTVAPVAAYAYLDTRASGGMRAWNAVTVEPFAAIAVTVDVPLGQREEDLRRVVVELHADMAHLTVDAHPPFIPTRRSERGRAAAGIAAALAAVLSVIGVFARPHVVALAAPERAAAGSHIDVAYATAGGGSWTYKLMTPNGYQLRAGALAPGTGSIDIDVPRAKALRSYDLQVTDTGPLGGDTRTTHIVALPQRRPAARQASIAALRLVRDVVPSGGPIIVTYRAHGTSGDLQLVDENGAAFAEAPTSALGTSTLTAPQVKRDQQFAVVLTVKYGKSTAQSSTGVVVRSGEPLYVDGAGGDAPTGDNVRHLPPQGDAPFALPADPIVGGGPIDIAVVDPSASMRFKVATPSGTVMTSGAAVPGQRSVVMLAPEVNADTPMLIEATYTSPIGEETIIRKVVVHRRPEN